MMRLRGRVQAVDRIGGDHHGRIEPEGVVGRVEVVVDRLGHADDRQAVLGQLRRHAQRVFAADRDECVDSEIGEVALDLLDTALDLDRVGARGAEDRAAARQDAAHRGDVEGHGDALERALPSVTEPDEVIAVLADAPADDRSDDRIEAGAIAAAGEDAYAHGDSWCRGL